MRLRSANGRPNRRAVDQQRNPARSREGAWGVVPGRVSFQAHPGNRCRSLRVRRAGKRANACRPKSNWRQRALRVHTPRPATVLNRSCATLRDPRRRVQSGRPIASLRKRRLRLRSANGRPYRWAHTAAISPRVVGGVRQRGLSASALRYLLQGFAIRRAAERRAMPPFRVPSAWPVPSRNTATALPLCRLPVGPLVQSPHCARRG